MGELWTIQVGEPLVREAARQAAIEHRLDWPIWFDAANQEYGAETGCPAFFFETPDGVYYGFPSIDGEGVKVAEHTGGAGFDLVYDSVGGANMANSFEAAALNGQIASTVAL